MCWEVYCEDCVQGTKILSYEEMRISVYSFQLASLEKIGPLFFKRMGDYLYHLQKQLFLTDSLSVQKETCQL